MRIIITQNTTLDGRVEMLDDWFDPQAQDDELLAEVRSQTAREQILLLGRQTFEDFRGFWPRQTADTTGIAAQLNKVDKWVFSTTMTDPEWENSRIIADDPLLAVAALREQPGLDAILTGSISLAHTLITAGLVDEYRMFTYPVWQGRGRGFFPGGHPQPPLALLDSRSFRSGVVYSAYTPAGQVPTSL
ncbi:MULTISPECIES: dihydrofolate reductase family protein [Brevibacterium]|uniref:Bifunctional deaminase-reductase domain-containing protein n=4 Tax=Bacteria TaxID=2 RepID=K9AT75_9MICO|nr:dihydrofolate reductase family protein [Brevibacterium casei]EKU45812.1 bifunctional deaminase-reductase domain-containing protein [Brevibacterium casei S18]MCT2358710.1 dihydrofolate reductase family protein [Brevibacterium casei]